MQLGDEVQDLVLKILAAKALFALGGVALSTTATVTVALGLATIS
ncbi:hypothetical protein [Mycolicibacterium hodleri]|nr:hypothetical protein [Mycolicibacterium hodleri]